jgi:hypothetical protein
MGEALSEFIPALLAVAFAPICVLMSKLAEKPGEYRQGRAGNWRQMALFRGLKRHFAGLGADGPRSQAAKLPAFTVVDSG